jgi:hypothetical protein
MKTSTKQDAATTMDGKFIKVVGDHLTFTNAKGQEHSFAVSKDVKVTSEGKEIKATELKAGSTIRMLQWRNPRYELQGPPDFP